MIRQTAVSQTGRKPLVATLLLPTGSRSIAPLSAPAKVAFLQTASVILLLLNTSFLNTQNCRRNYFGGYPTIPNYEHSIGPTCVGWKNVPDCFWCIPLCCAVPNNAVHCRPLVKMQKCRD